MTVPFRSKPENATLDAHAFAPLDDIWEYTAIPVLDVSEHLDDGTPICGQFTYADGMAALKRLGLEPLTAYDLETLHDLATRGECIELPAFTSTATAETSLAWRKVSDAANRANMMRMGWKPGMRVSNFGKGWVAGAPAGRAWLMGWWVPRVEAYGITERKGPGFIQPRPMPGSHGAHGANDHCDDGTCLWGKRRRSDTATKPPSGSVVGSVVDAVRSAASQAADVLRGLLASDGAWVARGPHELPDRLTPGTPSEVYAALRRAWVAQLGTEPKRASLLILCAQWALETGWGKSCHGWNLGNVKGKPDGSDGRSWAFFACNEILPVGMARNYVARAGQRRDGNGPSAVITRATATAATVWFYPPHPGCCFRAYATLDEGAADYLGLLRKRFASAWPAVVAGDPAAFGRALKAAHYYTADEAEYTRGLVSIVRTLDGRIGQN